MNILRIISLVISFLIRICYIYALLLLLLRLLLINIRFLYYRIDYSLFLEWEVLVINSTEIYLTFLLDWIRLRFSSIVFIISSIVIMYSLIYIIEDKYIHRFITLVFLFVLSIFLLIFRPNLISILLGWDGLGLVSYCLVIYYQNSKSSAAGLLTVLSNRIGDVAILLAISWFFNYGSWNFIYWQYIFNYKEVSFIIFLIIIAAITKRAQIPFSAWLPAAIAAPTPVSSLVHSSTLVTAGVYLLIRFSDLLGHIYLLLLISVLTIFISGVGANYEIDLKKIIALSTLRQLGVIIIVLSLGFKEIAFLHLITHALFKSLLFLCAGVYIHSIGDIQDIRLLGGVSEVFPVTRLFFSGCSLSLCGFPFLAGFYSKDLIIERFLIRKINILILFMLLIRTIITLTYSVRLILFMIIKNLGLNTFICLRENIFITLPITILFIYSIYVGSFFTWIFVPLYEIILPLVCKILILSLLILFLLKRIILFINSINWHIKFINKIKLLIIWFLRNIWFLPQVSTIFIIPLLNLGLTYLKIYDHGWFEKYGGQGIYTKLINLSLNNDYITLSGIKFYIIIIFIIIFILFIILFV